MITICNYFPPYHNKLFFNVGSEEVARSIVKFNFIHSLLI
uniref:Uncharacterized protein n=1 Tax=Lepeophtheirus salmonis TaxID=72036 RepID=A0A0K2UF47_LEPSM